MLSRRGLVLCVLTVFIYSSLNAAPLPTASYEVIDIGAQTGFPYSAGLSVSNSGYVAGLVSTGSSQNGFVWRGDIGVRLLEHPAGTGQSVADNVNDAGQVVGTSFSPSRGVLWNASGQVSNVFNSASIDAPTGLNDAGVVAGYRNTTSSQTAFVWNGSYSDLGIPSPYISSQGYDVNNTGRVGGTLNGGGIVSPFNRPSAFLWSPTSGFQSFLASAPFTSVAVRDLSNQNVLVGSGNVNGGPDTAGWRWQGSTGFSALPNLVGTATAQALAVNDFGLIAGSSGEFGVVWDAQGEVQRANLLLAPGFTNWNIRVLRGVNNDGWFTGEAVLAGSSFSQAVLLRPIPEPTSAAIALGSLWMFRRTR